MSRTVIAPSTVERRSPASAPQTIATPVVDGASRSGFPAWKRVLDLAVGLPLLALSVPIFGAAAIAARLTGDRGSVFYRAVRVGEAGRSFEVLKLRTMRTGLAGPAVTAASDARITSVGSFLRRTKLDELPQLWNVVLGQMSLVGPRPEDARFVDWSDPLHRIVFSARPGITGPAQIQFRHEERLLPGEDVERAYVERILPAKVVLDAAYLERRTLRRDLQILLRTLLAIAR